MFILLATPPMFDMYYLSKVASVSLRYLRYLPTARVPLGMQEKLKLRTATINYLTVDLY